MEITAVIDSGSHAVVEGAYSGTHTGAAEQHPRST
jgi:hypothetical protein